MTGRRKVMLSDFLDWFFLWELGYPTQFESGSSNLRDDLGDRFLWFMCMIHLWLEGLRGKKSTPSVDCEVQVRYQSGTTTSDSWPSVTVQMLSSHL
jgi:hypothetical protein